MWKTGGPDTSEMATPKRLRTSSSKYTNTIRFLVNGGQTQIMILKNKKDLFWGLQRKSDKLEPKPLSIQTPVVVTRALAMNGDIT